MSYTSQVVDLMSRKEHLTKEGLNKIVAMKASMNLGLSTELKAAFPHTIPVPRPLVNDQEIKDPQWVAGFVEGEGCFFVHIFKSKTKTGSAIKFIFQITQHTRDSELMKSLIEWFGCRHSPGVGVDSGSDSGSPGLPRAPPGLPRAPPGSPGAGVGVGGKIRTRSTMFSS